MAYKFLPYALPVSEYLTGVQALPSQRIFGIVPVTGRHISMDGHTFNGSAQGGGPNFGKRTQGQAALLLVESLMHALVEKGVLSREDFIETVEGAAEVEHELALANAMSPTDANGSILSPLAAAFRKELGK